MSNFPRPALARTIADELTDNGPLSTAQHGLFLAGPRRIGKSEFLFDDLKPELERRGMLVLYVDLWLNKLTSPMVLIADLLAHAVQDHLGAVAKIAKGMGLDKISLPGTLSIDLTKIEIGRAHV